MSKIIYGERIGKTTPLVVACDRVIFDGTKHKILLTKRTDNGEWCLPGGKMEPGESASECCVSEVLEKQAWRWLWNVWLAFTLRRAASLNIQTVTGNKE